MKQKRLGDILYVFDVNPYEITQDTDASIIKVQEESYKGFVEMNPDLAAKIVRFNYHVICVNTPEWSPYVEEDQFTFSMYGTGAAPSIHQIQVQNADNVIIRSWVQGVDLEFPFKASFNEGEHFAVEFADGVNPNVLNIIGDALSIGWQDSKTSRYWKATPALSASTSVGIESSKPSTHTVVVTSDAAIPKIMEQTPDHQTVVEDHTSPSFPLTMTVNDGNILAFNFGNKASYTDFDINPVGFFVGNWQDPDTGDNIAWTDPITNDVNVTIKPRTYTVTLEGGNIHDHVNVKMNGKTVSSEYQYHNVADGTVVDVYPIGNVADYALQSGAVWKTDHWTATVNRADLTISINYLGAGVNFKASWGYSKVPANVSKVAVCGHIVTGNDLTNPNWTETVRAYPGSSQVQYFVSTGLPTDMSKFEVDLYNGSKNPDVHFAYKQTDPDTGKVFYSDARDASGTTLQHPGIWQYNNTPETGLPYISFTFPEVDEDGNAFVDNAGIEISADVSGS